MIAFWSRVHERLADVAALCICITSAFATIHVASQAPEFAAVVIGAALIALAIYKRPPTVIRQHFDASDVTLQGARVDLSTAMAVKALQDIVDAAKSLPKQQETER